MKHGTRTGSRKNRSGTYDAKHFKQLGFRVDRSIADEFMVVARNLKLGGGEIVQHLMEEFLESVPDEVKAPPQNASPTEHLAHRHACETFALKIRPVENSESPKEPRQKAPRQRRGAGTSRRLAATPAPGDGPGPPAVPEPSEVENLYSCLSELLAEKRAAPGKRLRTFRLLDRFAAAIDGRSVEIWLRLHPDASVNRDETAESEDDRLQQFAELAVRKYMRGERLKLQFASLRSDALLYVTRAEDWPTPDDNRRDENEPEQRPKKERRPRKKRARAST